MRAAACVEPSKQTMSLCAQLEARNDGLDAAAKFPHSSGAVVSTGCCLKKGVNRVHVSSLAAGGCRTMQLAGHGLDLVILGTDLPFCAG